MMERYGSAPVILDVKELQGRILFIRAKWDVELLTSEGMEWGIWTLVVRFLPFCLVVTKIIYKFAHVKGYRYQLSS